MTKVARDMDKIHQRLIETLNRKHEREVKHMNEVHSQNTTEIKKGQAMDIVNIQENHEHQIADENEKKERILSQMKGNLEDSKRLTEKELKELGEFREKSAGDITTKYAMDRERIAGEHNEHIETMNDRYNQAVRRINLEGQDRVNLMNEQQTDLYADRKNYHQKRIDSLNIENGQRFKKDSESYLKVKNDQKRLFEKERMNVHKKQEADVTKMVSQHEKLYKQRDVSQRSDLKDQETFFEKRYAETHKRHNDHFQNLDQLQDKVVKKMKADMTKEVDFKNSRADDPFFQFVEMKPSLEVTETGVRIQVKVPDHSKQDLQLNLNGKEAVINFNRRYVDTQKDDQGNSSRVSKIETLSTRLNTGVHLDPKSVKSSYQNGVMTYEIKKA
jgi:HSP20 family molecular chaperone IbpA